MRKRIITAENVKLGDKVHALSHLFNSSVFLFILTLSLLSLPVLHIKDSFSDLNLFIKFGSIFITSTLFLMYYYWLSYRDKTQNKLTSFFKFFGRFVQFLVVSMGLSLSNTVAVLEGYLGIKSSFVRTPKFNVAKKNEFKFKLPNSGNEITYKLLTVKDEKEIDKEIESLKKIDKNLSTEVSTRLKHMILSVNGNYDKKTIRDFVDSALLARDSRALREHITKNGVGVDMTCSYTNSEGVEENIMVPVGIQFFWPDA
jgi:hypothetical protein